MFSVIVVEYSLSSGLVTALPSEPVANHQNHYSHSSAKETKIAYANFNKEPINIPSSNHHQLQPTSLCFPQKFQMQNRIPKNQNPISNTIPSIQTPTQIP